MSITKFSINNRKKNSEFYELTKKKLDISNLIKYFIHFKNSKWTEKLVVFHISLEEVINLCRVQKSKYKPLELLN